MLPAIIGGIASIGSALIAGEGQSQANAANAREAERNREFQERMRGSQYQTAVEDMRKAGLNPALAYQQGGAGTPTGSTAVHNNTAAGAPQAAGAALQTFQSLRKTAAEIQLINSQDLKTRTEAALINQDALIRILDKNRAYGTYAEQIERIKAESREAVSTAREADASATIRQLGIPEAQAIANFYRSSLGKLAPYISNGTSAARGIASLLLTRGRSLRRN